jgi:hypothetical protein
VASPSPAPAAAVPSPIPPLSLRIAARVDPPTPSVGTEFVIQLAVTNAGDRPAHGLYIATSGPWDRYSVLDVQPDGAFGRDAAGWHIVSPVEVPPGATRTVEVRARAEQPSDEQLTFAVREAEPGDLP